MAAKYCSGGDGSKPSGTSILPSTCEAISQPKCAPCFIAASLESSGERSLESDHNRQGFIVRFSIRVSVAEPIFRRIHILGACISFEGMDDYSHFQTKYKYRKYRQNHLYLIERNFPTCLCKSVNKHQNGATDFLYDFDVTNHKAFNATRPGQDVEIVQRTFSNAFTRNKLPEYW